MLLPRRSLMDMFTARTVTTIKNKNLSAKSRQVFFTPISLIDYVPHRNGRIPETESRVDKIKHRFDVYAPVDRGGSHIIIYTENTVYPDYQCIVHVIHPTPVLVLGTGRVKIRVGAKAIDQGQVRCPDSPVIMDHVETGNSVSSLFNLVSGNEL